MNEPRTTVWASIGQTINMGDYNSVKIDAGIAGVPVGASPEEINQLLEDSQATLEEVIHAVANKLRQRVQEDILPNRR